MPIVIKDYTWNQTETHLNIRVPFKVNPSKADLFISPRYIKISMCTLFFEVLLLEPIDKSKSKCTKLIDAIVFELVKCKDKMWHTLEPDMTKQEKFALKQQLIEEEHIRFQKECEEKSLKHSELKKVAVREQIQLETKQRENIEEIRHYEKNKALGDVETWTKSMTITEYEEDNHDVINPNQQICSTEDNDYLEKIKKINKFNTRKHKKEVLKKETIKKEKVSEVPKPRTSKSLQVLFTPRAFPTPSRESHLEEENEWLRKQAEARRSAGFMSEDIRPEERNPQYLLAKGSEFMKNKNYLAAVSAYSFGIKLSEKFVDLYIARSEAQMGLENFNRAINDCSSALDLLKPAVPINLEQRALCIGRRGVALCKLNMFKHGISELEISIKMLPNEFFQKALEEAKITQANDLNEIPK
ncbi:unnamed protein product [Brassicogethes aeneus]|uniref:CS domain-containing protein n=1 Tax=Brassicogethes aeneus TaxID=1431903 RepID=A0A9P0APL6_BRAAE|nr:unnamed protein product [Brassicogethes aeneus]